MNRLHISEITSIGAVEAGDNADESKILLYKSKSTEPEPGPLIEKGVSMPFDIETLTDDAKAYVSELEAKLAAFGEEPAALPDDLPEPVAKRLDEMTEAIEKERVEKERMAKELADLKDGIATEKWTERANALAVLLGSPDDVAPVLKTLASDSPDAFAKLDAMFDTLIVKDSMAPLFKELGSSAAEGSAADQIAAHAAEIRKADPTISVAKARAQAWMEHPELKALSREEA